MEQLFPKFSSVISVFGRRNTFICIESLHSAQAFLNSNPAHPKDSTITLSHHFFKDLIMKFSERRLFYKKGMQTQIDSLLFRRVDLNVCVVKHWSPLINSSKFMMSSMRTIDLFCYSAITWKKLCDFKYIARTIVININ